jgi:polyisoprenoid-binding protein YceI
MKRILLGGLAFFSLAAGAPLTSGMYGIDPKSSNIQMVVGGMLQARFTDFEGQVEVPTSDITTASVHFTTRVESVTTGDASRDVQLRGEKLLHAGRYPRMEFHSTKIQRAGNDYVLHGNLTVKGVTRPARVDFKLTRVQPTRFAIDGTTSLSSREFGIDYGNPFPGKDIQIRLQLEAKKKP